MRLAVAIGRDAKSEALNRFIGDPKVPVLVADSADQIAERLVVASLAVSRMSEVGADREALAGQLLQPPRPPAGSRPTRTGSSEREPTMGTSSRPACRAPPNRGRDLARIRWLARQSNEPATEDPRGRRRRRARRSRHFRSGRGSRLAVEVACGAPPSEPLAGRRGRTPRCSRGRLGAELPRRSRPLEGRGRRGRGPRAPRGSRGWPGWTGCSGSPTDRRCCSRS